MGALLFVGTDVRAGCAWLISGILEGRRTGFHGGGVHPHHFPDMAVRVFEAAAIHEAVFLLWGGIELGAGPPRLFRDRIHRLAAVAGEREQDLALPLRIDDRL